MTSGVQEFRNDDGGYLSWVAAHPRGYVINIWQAVNPKDARLHQATCPTILGEPSRGTTWTSQYIKVCSMSEDELETWVQSKVGTPVRRCGTCWRSRTRATDDAPAKSVQAGSARPPGRPRIEATTAPVYEFQESSGDGRDVQLWAERYIPFENLTPAQSAARDELRERLRSLVAAPGEILHASYAGEKPTNMDIENLLLYNIEGAGCFSSNVQHGVCFEFASDPTGGASPRGRYPCAYRYRLIPADSELDHWRKVRRLVTFTDVDLGQFPAAGRLTQTWLALHRSTTTLVESSVTSVEPVGVFLTLKVPSGGAGKPGAELVKSLMDGVVAAFQAHGDRATVEAVAKCLGDAMREEPLRIAELLLDQRRAALGVVDHLVRKRGTGVQWNPGDHMCVVGRLLRNEAEGRDWRLSGELWLLEPFAV